MNERTVNVPLVLLDNSDMPEGVVDRNRPLTLRRPCECGCDNRDAPTLVGYVNAITDGVGFTMEIHDEATYKHMEKALYAFSEGE